MTNDSKVVGCMWSLEIPGKILVCRDPESLPHSKEFPKAVDNLLVSWQDILRAMNIETLTPLQKRIIFSLIPAGMDLFVVGPKRCGKRTAYLLPVVDHIINQLYASKLPHQARTASPAAIICCDSTAKAVQLKNRLDDILSSIAIPSTSDCSSVTPCHNIVFIDNIYAVTPGLAKQPIDILILTGCSLQEWVNLKPPARTEILPIKLNRVKYVIFEEHGMEKYFWENELIFFIRAFRFREYKPAGYYMLPEHAQFIFSGSIWHHKYIGNVRQTMTGFKRKSALLFGSTLHALQFSTTIQWTVCQADNQEQKLKTLLSICQEMIRGQRKVVVACSKTEDASVISGYLLEEDKITTKVITCADEAGPSKNVSGIFGKVRDTLAASVYVIADNAWNNCTFYDGSCLIHFDLGGEGQSEQNVMPFPTMRFSSIWDHLKRSEGHDDFNLPGLTYFILSGDEPNFLAFYKFVQTLGDGVRLPRILEQAGRQKLKSERLKRPFCANIKSFAFCIKVDCPDRHEISQQDLDTTPDAPKNGELEFKVIQSISPSLYVAKLQKHYVFNEENKRVCVTNYRVEARTRILQMLDYFTVKENRIAINPTDFEIGQLYGCPIEHVTTDGKAGERKIIVYLRARIIGMFSEANPDTDDYEDFVEMFCVDSGAIINIPNSELLLLPKDFQVWKPLCVQVVLTNLLYLEHMNDYNCDALRAAKELSEGHVWLGKVLLSVCDTVWVNPMVQYDKDPVTGVLDFGCNLAVELFFNGHVVIHDNHHHMMIMMDYIRKLDPNYPEIEHEMNSSDVSVDEEDQFGKEVYHHLGDPIQWTQLPLSTLQDEDEAPELRPVPFKIYSVISPWEIYGAFWEVVTEEDDYNSGQLDHELTMEMKHLLANKEKHFEGLAALLQVGSVVAVKIDNDDRWRRGLILNMYKPEQETCNRVRVTLVDYGSIVGDLVELEQVVPIRKIFVEALPFQSICINLAHTKPMNGGNKWGENELQLFSSMIYCNNKVNLLAFHKLEETGCPCNSYQAMAYQQLLDNDADNCCTFEDIGVQLVQNKGAKFTADYWELILAIIKSNLASRNTQTLDAMQSCNGNDESEEDIEENDNCCSGSDTSVDLLMGFQTVDVTDNEFIAVAQDEGFLIERVTDPVATFSDFSDATSTKPFGTGAADDEDDDD